MTDGEVPKNRASSDLTSPGRNLQPVDLLPVASEAKVFENGLELGLRHALEPGIAVDPDFHLFLEVDQLRADPHIQPLDAVGFQPDQVAQAARGHPDRGWVQVLAEG